MTPEMAFKARELSVSGVWSGRIADLLHVDEQLVRRALAGDDFEEPPPQPPAVVDLPMPAPKPVDPNAWPPPVDEHTEWDTVHVSKGYARHEAVRVRWVMLWGQRVRINSESKVWCHFCLRFHTTKALGHPHNGCPVGLPNRGGLVRVTAEELGAEAANWRPGPLDHLFGRAR